MANFGEALMLLGMGMQGNSQGINEFFAKRQEAERNAKINELMNGLSGGQEDRMQKLGALAQLDPNTFARSYIEESRPLSPLDELQLQKNRLEIGNLQGEQEQKAASEAAARRALGIGGGQQQTPNFNPTLGNQVQPSGPVSQGITENSALSQLGIPMADNINSKSSESLGLPSPIDIQAMAQQLLQARTQGAPVTPITRETLPPMAAPPTEITQQPVTQPQTAEQPAATAPRITTPEEWAARPENKPLIALGPIEAAKGYNEFVRREQENATKLAEEQRAADAKSAAAAAEAQAGAKMMAQASEPVFNNIIDTVDVLLGNKSGLERVTGQWSLLPFNITPESRSAEANLSALKENLSVERLQQIRSAGFAPGTITEREWPRFENALVNLKNSQTYPEMVRNLNRLKEVTTGVQNIQRRAAGLPEIEVKTNDDPLGLRGYSQTDPLGIR